MEKFYSYDIEKYPFDKIVLGVFDNTPLNQLHLLIPTELIPTELYTQKNDSESVLHKKFYKKLNEGWPEMNEVYRSFIKNVIMPILGEEEIIFQKTPTFRAHIPNNLAVGAFHKDKDYNHPPKEINFIIPLTKAYESNTVIVESEPGKMDFHQVEMEHGQLLQFNGNECLHGNLPNKTGVTRVSLDFRVMKLKDYDPNFSTKSMTIKKKFEIGGYYEKI